LKQIYCALVGIIKDWISQTTRYNCEQKYLRMFADSVTVIYMFSWTRRRRIINGPTIVSPSPPAHIPICLHYIIFLRSDKQAWPFCPCGCVTQCLRTVTAQIANGIHSQALFCHK